MKNRRETEHGMNEPRPHSPLPLVAFRRLVGRSLVPPSLPLAAFGASFRGEWRVVEVRGKDKSRPEEA